MDAWRNFYQRWLWVVAAVVLLAMVATDTFVHWRTTATVTSDHLSARPVAINHSLTGYAWNQRDLILPYIGMDGYHWVMQTQDMLAGAGARVRAVDYDNAPAGREVHWSSSVRWWLAALAEIDHFYTGRPLAIAVEDVTPFANTLLITLIILLTAPAVARRFGSVPATFFILGPLAIGPLYQSFSEGKADHHGLAAISGLLTMLFLLGGAASWVRVETGGMKGDALRAWLPERRQARRWFMASGIAGGVGLWVSAASEAPMLVEIGVGALLAGGWLGRNLDKNESARPDPTLWRIWGLSGAAASLFFYLLEYFPAHFGWRLEVNHPLYALAWAGGGELVCRLCRWLNGGKLAANAREFAALALSAAAVGALPAVVWLFPDRTFWVADRFLWAFHVDYIAEFKPMWSYWKGEWGNYADLIITINLLMLLGLPMIYWIWRPGWPRPLKALLLLTLPAGLITLSLSFWQMRWEEISYALWLAALVAVATALSLHTKRRPSLARKIAAGIFLACTLLPGPTQIVWRWFSLHWIGPSSQVELMEIVSRDVAQRLRARLADEPGLVVSGPTTTTWMAYWGGMKGLGTLYWENLAGLKATAAIYGAPSPDAALPLVTKYGVTHFVIFSWDPFVEEYTRLAHGLRASEPVPQQSFSLQLLHGVPRWLRPLYYPMPNNEQLKNQIVYIFEVAPGQTDAEAALRTAQWQIAAGNLANAAALVDHSLNLQPDYLPALICRARIQKTNNLSEPFANTVAQIRRLLPQADKLALDDRIDLAGVFALAVENDLVHDQLVACLSLANATNLRHLGPEQLFNLLYLSQQLGLMNARPGLWPFASSLLPLAGRSQLLFEYATSEKLAGRTAHALALLRQIVAIDPQSALASNMLAFILATAADDTLRNGREAVAFAKQTQLLDPSPKVDVLDALACAYAECGEYGLAVAVEDNAIQLATTGGGSAQMLNTLRTRAALFHNNTPYHEPRSRP